MRKLLPMVGDTAVLLLSVCLAGHAESPRRIQVAAATDVPGETVSSVPAVPASWVPTSITPATPELLALGKATYEKQCVTCHGSQGQGDGPAAYLLYPKPRNFVAAQFRLVSTWERTPTDEDLFSTLSRGMPGSAMPSWAHLPEQTRWGLVYYVKSFAQQPWSVRPAAGPKGEGEPGTGVIAVPPEPPYTPEAQEQAANFFKDACAGCHGLKGRGDGAQAQVDNEGFPTRPRDLTRGIFKGSTDPASIYRRIVAGMPGTPMPMSDWAYGENAWRLVHYVLGLSSEEQRAKAPIRRLALTAIRVRSLPKTPEDKAWEGVEQARVQLTPLWWRNDRIEAVGLQAAHDGRRLAIRLSWEDQTPDDNVIHQQGFTDGAAVQFSESTDPPLFAMGTLESPVNIWHWKAVWERDAKTGYAALADVFPNMSRTLYPGTPTEAAYTTGRAAGNPLSQETHPSSAEDLNAAGFGTLTSQKAGGQNVDGAARWADGRWEVVFIRDLVSDQPGDIPLTPGQTVSVAFAVWDGHAGDRNGQKSVSIWHTLTLGR